MSDNGHDLHAAFPEEAEILHRLKLGSAPFQLLARQYHRLAGAIHRSEAGIELASDQRLEEMKKERLAILDEVARLIADVKAAA